MRPIRRFALLGVLALTGACEDSLGPVPHSEAIIVLSFSAAPASVAHIALRVAGPGIEDTLAFSLSLDGGDVVDTLALPPGGNRYVLADAFDISGTNTFRADTTLTLHAGLNPPLLLVLRPLSAAVPVELALDDSLATIVIDPTDVVIGEEDTYSLRATAFTADGYVLPDVSFTWHSGDTTVVKVDQTGFVTAVGSGTTYVFASSDGVQDSASVSVDAPSDGLPSDSALVAYYPLDGDADDHGVNGFHGTVSGAVPASGRFGTPSTAMLFDGQDDYIKLPYDPAFYPSSVGLSAWFWVEHSVGPLATLVSAHGTGSPLDPYHLFVRDADSLTATFEGSSPPADAVAVWAPVVTGAWQHVAASYDGTTGEARIWRNGTLVDDATNHFALAANTLGVTLGADMDASGVPEKYFLPGLLDEVRIYSRPLSQEDVDRLCDVAAICP